MGASLGRGVTSVSLRWSRHQPRLQTSGTGWGVALGEAVVCVSSSLGPDEAPPTGPGLQAEAGGCEALTQAKPADTDITSRAGCPANDDHLGSERCLFGERAQMIGGGGPLTSFNPAVDALTAACMAPAQPSGVVGEPRSARTKAPRSGPAPRCGLASLVSPGCGRPAHLPHTQAERPADVPHVTPSPEKPVLSPPHHYRPLAPAPQPRKRAGHSNIDVS